MVVTGANTTIKYSAMAAVCVFTTIVEELGEVSDPVMLMPGQGCKWSLLP